MPKKQPTRKTVEAIKHDDDKRKNIPTAEFQPVLNKEEQKPLRVAYDRRNRDLDPQLMWRGKDEQDWSDLVVSAPPLYIQEKVHPQVLIEDLLAQTKAEQPADENQLDLFADFNGIPSGVDKTEFYQHDQNWSNRMILGDSLQVMASLAEREGLRGKVQCIYFGPPYGIKFNSNFQWSTTSRDVKDGKGDHITREPEQVKAFRDTWRDGIHSYLTYLRDRLTVARDLLTESGSIFVQIGDENVHRVRAVMDEVLGEDNFVTEISYATTSGFEGNALSRQGDYILWYSKKRSSLKYRSLFIEKSLETLKSGNYCYAESHDLEGFSVSEIERKGLQNKKVKVFRFDNLLGQGASSEPQPFNFQGHTFNPPRSAHWKSSYPIGMSRLSRASRIHVVLEV
jgi:adenine-specific DNA-methyltransferase